MKPTLLTSKKGMSLPAMLAIVLFLMASVLGLLSFVVFQANLTDKNIEFSQEYTNAITDIKTVQHIIARDKITDPAEIDTLAAYLGVNVETVGDSVYRFSKDLEAVNRTVDGYLAPKTEIVSTYEEIFAYQGNEEDFELSPLVNATTLLDAYLNEYIPETFPDATMDGDFSTFQGSMDYLYGLTPDYYTLKAPGDIENQVNPDVFGYWYVDGNVTLNNQDLTVADGHLLVIDGNLETNGNAHTIGNFVINGDLIIDGRPRQDRQIIGTFYVNGDVEITRDTIIGSPERPAFIFANGSVSLGNNVTVYGYIISDSFTGQQGANFIQGGVYTHGDAKLPRDFQPGENLSQENLDDYAVTSTIIVETQEQGETTFTYTNPRLS